MPHFTLLLLPLYHNNTDFNTLSIMDTIALAPASDAAPQRASLPNARDMSHHLNSITKRRQANKLKELYRYAAMPGMIPMAGGELAHRCAS